MNIVEFSNHIPQISADYTPQIIGLIGTIIGTILGWVLSSITNNAGKLNISFESFKDCKNNNKQYAYILCLFICNFYLKPKFIKNIRIVFYHNKEIVFENWPKKENLEINYSRIKDLQKADIIILKCYEPIKIYLCDIIEKEDFDKIANANRIIMFYESTNGRTKKMVLKKSFCINITELYQSGKNF